MSSSKQRLRGTLLYVRVLRERRGLRRGYNAVHNAWRDNSSEDEKSNAVFLLFDYYSNMMAVLTSAVFPAWAPTAWMLWCRYSVY